MATMTNLLPFQMRWDVPEYSRRILWLVPNGGHLPLPPYLDPKNESDFIKRTMEFLNGDWDKK
jgi:hypothetical protein